MKEKNNNKEKTGKRTFVSSNICMEVYKIIMNKVTLSEYCTPSKWVINNTTKLT